MNANTSNNSNAQHQKAVQVAKLFLKDNLKGQITEPIEQHDIACDLSFSRGNKEYFVIVIKIKFKETNSQSSLNAINSKKWEFMYQHINNSFIVAVSEIDEKMKCAIYTPQQIWESSRRIEVLKYCTFKKNKFSVSNIDELFQSSNKIRNKDFEEGLKKFIQWSKSISD